MIIRNTGDRCKQQPRHDGDDSSYVDATLTKQGDSVYDAACCWRIEDSRFLAAHVLRDRCEYR
jgi:hypothetical protein